MTRPGEITAVTVSSQLSYLPRRCGVHTADTTRVSVLARPILSDRPVE